MYIFVLSLIAVFSFLLPFLPFTLSPFFLLYSLSSFYLVLSFLSFLLLFSHFLFYTTLLLFHFPLVLLAPFSDSFLFLFLPYSDLWILIPQRIALRIGVFLSSPGLLLLLLHLLVSPVATGLILYSSLFPSLINCFCSMFSVSITSNIFCRLFRLLYTCLLTLLLVLLLILGDYILLHSFSFALFPFVLSLHRFFQTF